MSNFASLLLTCHNLLFDLKRKNVTHLLGKNPMEDEEIPNVLFYIDSSDTTDLLVFVLNCDPIQFNDTLLGWMIQRANERTNILKKWIIRIDLIWTMKKVHDSICFVHLDAFIYSSPISMNIWITVTSTKIGTSLAFDREERMDERLSITLK